MFGPLSRLSRLWNPGGFAFIYYLPNNKLKNFANQYIIQGLFIVWITLKTPTILCLIKIIRKFIPFLHVILLEMCVFCYIKYPFTLKLCLFKFSLTGDLFSIRSLLLFECRSKSLGVIFSVN